MKIYLEVIPENQPGEYPIVIIKYKHSGKDDAMRLFYSLDSNVVNRPTEDDK